MTSAAAAQLEGVKGHTLDYLITLKISLTEPLLCSHGVRGAPFSDRSQMEQTGD